MALPRILGIALLVVGVILLVYGLSATDSLVDEASKSFTGRYTDNTMIYLVGGAAAAVAGLLLALRRG
jgi:drug/metabolite transporter (DMT)-like permease